MCECTRMRGEEKNQSALFHYFSIESLVPETHPIRRLRQSCDEALKRMDAVFDAMYSDVGRPSIAPERLLKSQILIALYSVRSDELFCEMLGYNLLFRWFLGMSMEEAPFDRSTFSKNRQRLIEHEVVREFLSAVVSMAKEDRLISGEHFTVDGTLIEAWASTKSFQPKGEGNSDTKGKGPRNPDIDFRGKKRRNETHQSTTDPESRLYRKGNGRESKLAFMGHTLMENRNGLIIDAEVTEANGVAEREAALRMLQRQDIRRGTLGADKGYYARDFVKTVRDRGVVPHVAAYGNRRALDHRTIRHETYRVSQRKRKLIEQGFGWMKTVAGLRKTLLRGIERNDCLFAIRAAVYNLVRMFRLLPTA